MLCESGKCCYTNVFVADTFGKNPELFSFAAHNKAVHQRSKRFQTENA